MANEILDIFDSNYNHIGTADRNSVHEQGLWHQTFHCWIVQPNGKILFQLRGKDKSSSPNKLDISAAGHLEVGETPFDGVREVEEEVGLVVKFDDLVNLGIKKSFSERIDKNYINKEFCHTYLYKSNMEVSEYIMQKDEVAGLFEADIKDCFKLFAKEVDSIVLNGFDVDRNNISKNVSINNFVDHGSTYFIKILIMVERLLEGKKYLAI